MTFEKTMFMKSTAIKSNNRLPINALNKLSNLNGGLAIEAFDIPFECFFDSRNFNEELMQFILERIDRTDFNQTLNNHHSIIDYIRSNHLYYLDNALPGISLAFWRAFENTTSNVYTLKLCSKLFNDFSSALLKHIEEEELFFNLISKNQGGLNGAINFFSCQHENEHEALDELVKMLSDLTNNKAFDPLSMLIVQLQNLSADLKIHNFVEEKVLLPALIASAKKQIRLSNEK